jgi:hypothetical protein
MPVIVTPLPVSETDFQELVVIAKMAYYHARSKTQQPTQGLQRTSNREQVYRVLNNILDPWKSVLSSPDLIIVRRALRQELEMYSRIHEVELTRTKTEANVKGQLTLELTAPSARR